MGQRIPWRPGAWPLLILLCFGCGQLSAEAGSPQVPRKLLIWVLPGETPADTGLQDLLRLAVGVEALRLGLEPVSGLGEPDIQAAAQSSRVAGAIGFVVVGHAEGPSGLEVDLSLYEVTRGDLVARATATGQLDLRMGARLAAAARELLSPLMGDSATQAALPVEVPEVETEAAPVAAEEAAATPGARRFRMSLSGGAFLSAGTTAAYFPVAPSAGLSVGLVPPILGNHLSLGLRLSVLRAVARGVAADGLLYLLPVGVEVALRGRESDPVFAYGSVSGGAALLRVTPNGVRTLTKAIPWASATVGFAFRLGAALGLQVEVAYTVYFERYAPIMGFAPLMGVYLAI